MRRLAALLIVFVFAMAPARAQEAERITEFDALIDVQKDGDIAVTESISVIARGFSIKRGIYRDLPRFYMSGASRLPYRYDVKEVLRDGKKEPFAIETDGGAYRIRIGDAEVFLDDGPHRYSIAYEVKNQVRYFDGYDEFYWNVTGAYWQFAIDKASARARLPGGAPALQTSVYTGGQGETGRHATYAESGGVHSFRTSRPLSPNEGMTIAIGFAKGVVDPPSAEDARADWWARNASLATLLGAMLALGVYYLLMWRRVGIDPPKGPVFARYEPPPGYSPSATHYIYNRGLSGDGAFISALMNMAVKKRLRIDTEGRKRTTLTALDNAPPASLSEEDRALESQLLGGYGELTFGGKYNATLTAAYERFKKSLAARYGEPYFRWNRVFLVVAIALTAIATFVALNYAIEWTSLHTGLAILLGAMALAASYFLPAATQKGQERRTEIEGFRLYLKTAEALHLNAVKVGDEGPPPMTVERYERFLPYAVALGVEQPWTKHFEKLMPREADSYRPSWAGSNFSGRSISSINNALVSGISSGVASSLPQSNSSSGSGGGGFSGGGGGGGGGGGW
jgi:uncharacterized membrane protein YgcG